MLQDFRQKVIIIFFLGKSDVALSVYGNFSKIVLKDINNVRTISGWFLVNCGGGEKTMVRVILFKKIVFFILLNVFIGL